jgi:translation initiation factor IF-1
MLVPASPGLHFYKVLPPVRAAPASLAAQGQGGSKRPIMAKEELDGIVIEVLPDARCVRLDPGREIVAYIATIKETLAGDVNNQMCPYDLEKGRLIFRQG